jgi:hypothetical protein
MHDLTADILLDDNLRKKGLRLIAQSLKRGTEWTRKHNKSYFRLLI